MSGPSPLKIAYLCDLSPKLSWTYSGGNARIYNAMQSHVGDVQYIDNGWGLAEPLRKLVLKTPDAINIRARWRLHYALSRVIARHVQRQLLAQDFNVVMGVYSMHSMAHLKVPANMLCAFTSDATQSSYRTSEIGAGFGSYFTPGRLLDGWVKQHETRTLLANDLNLWPSDWQKEVADRCYGLEDPKSLVLPWGANIATPDAATLKINQDFSDGLRLLLVGRDWWAKGGPMVLETLAQLRQHGIKARLSVVGTTPPKQDLKALGVEEAVDIYPNLDKTIPADLETFEGLFRNSHFLVQPSLESYGFAFCEASAFALPSLCMRRGGVPVWDGVNGHAIAPDAGPEAFVEIIQGYLADPATYVSLRQSARQCFDEKLNWAAWGKGLQALLRDRLAQKRHAINAA